MKRETATAAGIPADRADAYFEMVGYPARMLSATGQLYLDLADDKEQSKRLMQYIHDETRRYNEQIAGGKWKGMMADTMVGQSWPHRGWRQGQLEELCERQASSPVERTGGRDGRGCGWNRSGSVDGVISGCRLVCGGWTWMVR